MLTKTKAIVLNTLKYGDKKIFVDMFSQEYGKITFSCPVGSRGKQKSKANYFQPLNIVEVEFDRKPKVEIHNIKEVRLAYPTRSIPYDSYKLSISIFLAEFLRYALLNEQQNVHLYDYIEHSIEWLDNAEKGFANFHIVFMMKISLFIGFHPNIEDFSPGSWFDLQSGEFSHLIPKHKDTIQPSEATIIPVIDRLNYSTMHLLKLTRAQRNQCTEGILNYYRLHLPAFPELKSFAVMKELFA
ncbi:MAG: DNA repair protein RecO [Prevotellaceae bacterium]|nr:DNA repair protein RecO [Prevotellaceae bacterium]